MRAILPLLLIAGLGLAACSDGSGGSGRHSGTYNDPGDARGWGNPVSTGSNIYRRTDGGSR